MNRAIFIEEMKKYEADDAEVGIFWYDSENAELFEVHSIPVSQLGQGQTTFPKLHKTIWQKLKFSTEAKKDSNKHFNPIYLNDYTEIPRGRVFFISTIFYVVTGSWITNEIKKKILDEFNLPPEKTLFGIDKHWEIGHGWSTENQALNFEEITFNLLIS